MNIVTSCQAILLVPWRSTRRGMQWYMGVILALTVIVPVALDVFVHNADAPPKTLLASISAFGLAFFNAFVLAPALLLAVDARQLRLPGMQRIAGLSVVVYVMLEVALLTALFGTMTGDAATVAAIVALGAVTGIAWGLLPRYFSIVFGFGPMAFNAFHTNLDLPGAGQPGFLSLMGALVLTGVIASVVCWRRELRAASAYGQSFSRPMVAMFRNNTRGGWNGWSGFAGGAGDSTFMLRQRPEWMQPRADLRNAGPSNVRKSLRIFLGGTFMPQTWISLLRSALFVLVPSLFMVLMMGLMVRNDHHGDTARFMHAMAFMAVVWGGGFGGCMVVLVYPSQLRQRWAKSNGELPLLALLPRLGTHGALRRDLLAASLLPPLLAQTFLFVVTTALGAWLGIGAIGLFALVLCQLIGMGCVVAVSLCVMGLCMPSPWVLAPLSILGGALLLGTLMSAVIQGFEHGGAFPLWLADTLSIGWSVLIVALLWLGRRGWRAYQALPQLFMQP